MKATEPLCSSNLRKVPSPRGCPEKIRESQHGDRQEQDRYDQAPVKFAAVSAAEPDSRLDPVAIEGRSVDPGRGKSGENVVDGVEDRGIPRRTPSTGFPPDWRTGDRIGETNSSAAQHFPQLANSATEKKASQPRS